MLHLFQGFSENSLRSFSWNMGTCVPQRLLGSNDYLQLKQKCLESLRLVTDASCISSGYYAISSFENLKTLSWTGLLPPEDIEDLRKALGRSSGQLEHLELDLIDWYELDQAYGLEPVPEAEFQSNINKGNFLAFGILDLPRDEVYPVYRNLQSLSLSAVSFKGAAKKISQGFSFASLRSLKIRHCPGWTDFLNHIAQSEQTLRQKCLEIQSPLLLNGEQVKAPERAIKNILSAFQGLEDLRIALTDTKLRLLCWQSLFSHKATLKSFVHHLRYIDMENQATPFELDGALDFRDDGRADDYAASFMENPSQNPLRALDLGCIGLCYFSSESCKVLKNILEPFAEKNTLKLVHLRQSGPDFAFVPNWGVEHKHGGDIECGPIDDSTELGSPQAEIADSIRKPEASSHKSHKVVTDRLHEFAQWAFGPEGIKSLRIIAFGDFSHNGRWASNNMMLCRQNEPAGNEAFDYKRYRELGNDDQNLRNVLERYMHVLEACPALPVLDPIIY
ncbi:MAG: hypothetical protein Q9160_007571 [Pyrenula sp. 1 TL-2023]